MLKLLRIWHSLESMQFAIEYSDMRTFDSIVVLALD